MVLIVDVLVLDVGGVVCKYTVCIYTIKVWCSFNNNDNDKGWYLLVVYYVLGI